MYVDALWLEQKYPAIRRLKKLGLESWIEYGGYIAARYVGASPFVNLPKDYWQPSTGWKHKVWYATMNWFPADRQERIISCWTDYMCDRISTVLGFKRSGRNLVVRTPRKVESLRDVIFVVKAECIR